MGISAKNFALVGCLGFVVSLCGVALAQSGSFTQADTSRVSVGTYPGATQANAASTNSVISRDGRFVVFESTATNLVNYVSVTPGRRHVYLLDRQAGSLELVSINKNNVEAAGDSFSPSVSADGRYVAFVSTAHGNQFFGIELCSDNVHLNIFYPGTHIYVRDRLANATFLASQVTTSVRFQAGACDEDPVLQTTKKCRTQGCNLNNPPEYTYEPVWTTVEKRVSAGILPYRTGFSTFTSATSLNPKISGDGRYIVFDTDADNFGGFVAPKVYLTPIPNPANGCVSGADPFDYCNSGVVTTNGVLAVPRTGFPQIGASLDNNNVRDVAVRDGQLYTTKVVSLGCVLHATGGCIGLIQGQRDSTKPQISDDGKYVSFQSDWNFLSLDFNGVKDIFLVERSKINDEVANLSRISNNTSRLLAANGESINSAMSADGRYVAFETAASNIITTDGNAKRDVYVYDTKFFVTIRCGTASAAEGNGDSTNPAISGGGNFISYQSDSTNWGATTPGRKNIFVGQLIRDSIGRLSSCQVKLASPGSSGSGGNADVTLSSVGVVPRTSLTPTAPRVQIPAISYQSLATDLHTGTADTNNLTDIFQAPGCDATDLVTDTDGDGTIDCFDQCKIDPLKVTDMDADQDGYPDCEDGCSTDSQKSAPGVCGCGVLDTDSDSDGSPDCQDKCQNDPAKTDVGICGCGAADADLNTNGIIDCIETQAPSGTPTPGGSPTAVPTTVATATPFPNLPTLNPGTIKIERSGTRAFRYTITPALDLGDQFLKYNIILSRVVGSSVSEIVVGTRSTTGSIRNLRTGRYTAQFRIVSTTGSETKRSRSSGVFIAR